MILRTVASTLSSGVPCADGPTSRALLLTDPAHRSTSSTPPGLLSTLRNGWATTAILAVLLAVFVTESLQSGGPESIWVLRRMGAITPETLSQGQTWRLIASMFLHIGPVHLLGNAIALFWLGRMAESLYGPLRYVGIYLVSGLGGSLLTALVANSAVTAGASGAIWGIMGALLSGSWRNRNRGPRISGREIRQSIVGMITVNAIISLTPGVSLTSHVGGFLAGIALGMAILFPGAKGQKARTTG